MKTINQLKSLHNKKGFTLIELLIVIALLGALAIGLLAAVDPFEQLKKGTDTSTRNTAAEFYNGAIRYYAQRQAFPWIAASDNVTSAPDTVYTLDTLGNTITEMGNAGELKADFYNLAGTNSLNKISLYLETSDKLIVCLNPQSKAFRNDANTKYDVYGQPQATNVCPNSNASDCYVCFQ